MTLSKRVLAVMSALVMALIALHPLPARADAASGSVSAAADYLAQTWTKSPGQFFSAGAVADGIIALSAADSHPEVVSAMLTKLRTLAPSYVGSPGSTPNPAGLAKVILALEASNQEPRHFLGNDRDLVAELISYGQAGGPNVTTFWAPHLIAITLTRAGEPVPTPVVDALLSSQSGGAFGYRSGGTFYADPDYTAMGIAAMSLLSQHSTDASVVTSATASLSAAIAWAQDPANQKFDAAGHQYWATYSSANSTGMLASVLSDVGQDVSSPVAYLVDQQARNTVAGAWSASHNGTSANVMATTQAILGVAGDGYATVLSTQLAAIDFNAPVVPSATPTPTVPSPTTSAAPSPSVSAAPSTSPSPSVTPTRTNQPSVTASVAPSSSESAAPSPSASASSSQSAITSPAVSASPSVSATPSVSPSPAVSPSGTPVQSATPTPAALALTNHAGACRAGEGVTVVIDYQGLGGNPVIRCAVGDPESGVAAVRAAGFTLEGVSAWGDAFVCRLNGRPTLAEDVPLATNPTYHEKCRNTPPAAAYWSYWQSGDQGLTWDYSNLGAMSADPAVGDWEGWSFSLNATAATNPFPRTDLALRSLDQAPVTVTTTATVSSTATETTTQFVTQPAETVTATATQIVTQPAETVTATATQVVTQPAETVTATATQIVTQPAETVTATATQLVTQPAETVTATATQLVTQPAETVTATATQVVTLPAVTVTVSPSAVASATVKPSVTPSASPKPVLSPSPSPSAYVFKRTAPYTVPGIHQVNGRTWSTTCEAYSTTQRCRTSIWGTTVVRTATGYQKVTGWSFNNLTYLPLPQKAWQGNPLGSTGQWTDASGRKWRTECNTETTGANACRTYVMVTLVSWSGSSWMSVQGWVFNNIVLFVPGS